MTSPDYSFEIHLPRDGKSQSQDDYYLIEAAAGAIEPDWITGDGFVRWVAGGVELLDGSFGWYIENHISAVCEVLYYSLVGESRQTGIDGSVIRLTTRPADVHHARITCVCERKTRPLLPREERSAVINCRAAARSVVDYMRLHFPDIDAAIGNDRPRFTQRERDRVPPCRVPDALEWFWLMEQLLKERDNPRPARHRSGRKPRRSS